MRFARLAATAGAAGALLLVGACGSSSGGSDASDSPSKTTSTSASTTPTTSSSGSASGSESASSTGSASGSGAAPSGDLTEGGATLDLGKPALVNWADSSDDEPSVLQVTVTKVDKGSLDDFTGSSKDTLAGYTPYYITATFVAGTDNASDYPSPDNDLGGVSSSGASAQTLITIGLSECKSPNFPKTLTAGTSVSGCQALVVPEGQTLDQVTFPAGPSRNDGVITWKN